MNGSYVKTVVICTLFIIILLLQLVVGYYPSNSAEQYLSINVDVKVPKPKLVKDGEYYVLEADNLPKFIVDSIAIPYRPILICLPQESQVINVNLKFRNLNVIPLSGKIQIKKLNFLSIVNQFSSVSKIIGLQDYIVEGPYLWEGVKILIIRAFPIKVDSKGIMYYEDIHVSVKAVINSKAITPRPTSPETISFLLSYADNKEDLSIWMPNNLDTSKDLLIITSDELTSIFENLSNFYQLRGIKTYIVTTSFISSNVNGSNLSDKIRNYIISAYQNLTIDYVILGGDSEIIPPAYIYFEDAKDADGSYYKATDLYYALLDGDWDPNKNGKLLEQLDEDGDGIPEKNLEPIPDIFPEVMVGRIPVNTVEEATNEINKIINYLLHPNGSWFNKSLLLGAILNYENEDNSNYEKTDGAATLEYIGKLLKKYGITLIKAYEEGGLDPSEYPHDYPLNKENVYNLISSGVNFIAVSGHGSKEAVVRKIWASDDGDNVPERSEMLWKSFMDKYTDLKLGNSTPFIYIDACLTGFFDSYYCLAEYLIKKGFIGVVASTRVSYYMVGWSNPGQFGSQEFHYLFWKYLCSSWYPSTALYYSKLKYAIDRGIGNYAGKKDFLIFIYFGDPTIMLWHKTPYQLAIETNIVNDFLNVRVYDPYTNSSLKNAIVTIINQSSGEIINQVETNEKGIACINITNLIGIPIKVYVYKDGYLPISRELTLYDITPPIIHVLSPQNNGYYASNNITISYIATDDSLVNWTRFKILFNNSVIFDSGIIYGNQCTYIITLEDGEYTLVVIAVDIYENTATESLTFTIDTTPPIIYIISPINNSYYNTTNIQLSVEANEPISRWEYSVDQGSFKEFNGSITLSLTEGNHSIIVKGIDLAGNENSTKISFIIDVTPPKILIINPVNGSISNSSVVRIEALADEPISKWMYSMDEGPYIQFSGNITIKLRDGTHTLSVKGVDYAGNVGLSTVRFTIDTKPPAIIIISPVNNSYYNRTTILLLVNSTEEIAKWEYSIDNGPYTLFSGREEVELSEGSHTISFKCWDLAGNYNVSTVYFTIDITPPEIYVITPLNNSILNVSKVQVNVTANEPILKWLLSVDSAVFKEFSGYITLTFKDGNHSMTIKGIDYAGNYRIIRLYITIDTKPPVITIINPINGTYYNLSLIHI